MSDNDLLREILEQPAVLARVYERYVARKSAALEAAAALAAGADHMYIAGMTTSLYASYPASILLDRNGKAHQVHDVSELLHYHLPALHRPRSCLVLVSQSGNSAEIVRILQEVKGALPVVGVYNDETSYLARHCDIGLPIHAGPQRACGTKTNLASVAVLLLLAEAVPGNALEPAGAHLQMATDCVSRFFTGWEDRVADLVEFLDGAAYTVFLGRGPGRTSAMFTATLFREVPRAVAEGMGAASFRHGLWEMIRPEHRVVVFAPEGTTHGRLLQLARDVAGLGVPTLVVTNAAVAANSFRVLRLDPLDELWTSLLDIVPLQLAAYLLARRRGFEPGKLEISSYVTTVE